MKIFLTIFIFFSIGFFGVFNFGADQILGGINSLDILFVLLNLVFIHYLLQSKNFRHIVFSSPIRYLMVIYFGILFVFFTMPLRGEISIIDAIRVGRNFLIIPLIPLITYDILKNNSGLYYKKIIFIIAAITSLQISITSFNPEIIGRLFPHARAIEGLKYGFQRPSFLSVSMLFPHLAALILLGKLLKERGGLKEIILFCFFVSAAGLQGFRSYFITLLGLILIILIKSLKFNNINKFLISVFIIFSFFLITDNYISNNQITSKVTTFFIDFETEDGSTLNARNVRNSIYILPKFLEKPFFGWGFIYHSSPYGKSIGLISSEQGEQKTFNLYSIDSGYLTMLNYFGIIGCFIFIFYLSKVIFYFYRRKYSNYSISYGAIGFIILLTFTLYTHGAFFSDFGLLPLSLIIGIATASTLKNISNEIQQDKKYYIFPI